MKNRIRDVSSLLSGQASEADVEGARRAAERFPMAITPYYASLIQKLDPRDPIFRMSVPQLDELCDPVYLRRDPLEEDRDMPIPGLVHRYRDRALIVTTSTCAMYCRHCTRKRVAGQRDSVLSPSSMRKISAYLRAHPEIHDVIVSGGDAFTMSTRALERVLACVRAVPSVDIIRIGTRVPVTMPMRVTDELVDMLKRYHPQWINVHFNHPVEMSAEASAACAKLADAGIPLGNQSVLLRGVNDDLRVMEELCRKLVRNRVRPYYLFQCDLVRGVEHFRTPLTRGVQIMEYLRGRISGLAIPLFIVDTLHGSGKVPVLPNYVVSQSPTHTVLRNYQGFLTSYPEPFAVEPIPIDNASLGVSDLACGRITKLVPGPEPGHHRKARVVAGSRRNHKRKGFAMASASSGRRA
ncbi:MAG: KamA family radical SAM protein [Deltaproteobacteria bacterium]|nr:KamA family radical SAM protein [Deltaproteobacteria bacterium]